MWLLFWLSLGWFISSVMLHFGERRGIRMTNPIAKRPGFGDWWRLFCCPYVTVYRTLHAVVGYLVELTWRLVKG